MCDWIGNNGNRLGLLSQLSLLNPFARRNDRHSHLGEAFVFPKNLFTNHVNLTIFKHGNFYSVNEWNLLEIALEKNDREEYVNLIKKERKGKEDNGTLEEWTGRIVEEVEGQRRRRRKT